MDNLNNNGEIKADDGGVVAWSGMTPEQFDLHRYGKMVLENSVPRDLGLARRRVIRVGPILIQGLPCLAVLLFLDGVIGEVRFGVDDAIYRGSEEERLNRKLLSVLFGHDKPGHEKTKFSWGGVMLAKNDYGGTDCLVHYGL